MAQSISGTTSHQPMIGTPIPIIRCAIYTRKSVFRANDFAQPFSSLEAQEDTCKKFIESRSFSGFTYLRTFTDAGISGGTMNRPALQELLAAAGRKEVDMVVVYKLDRLARNQRDFLNMLDLLDRNGVQVASVSEQFDTSTPVGRAMRNLLGVFAQMEREVISERTKAKIEAARARGYVPGGSTPFGYMRSKLDLLVDKETAPIVQRIFREYAEEGGTCIGIARSLNEDGLTKRGRSGSPVPWNTQAVGRILRNVIYIGLVPNPASPENPIPGQHHGIIGEELWQQVQRKLNDNKLHLDHRFHRDRPKGRPRKEAATETGWLLPPGLAVCAACGSPLIRSDTKKRGRLYSYYSCRGRKQSMKSGSLTPCGCPNISAPVLDLFVMQQIVGHLGMDYLAKRLQERLPHRREGDILNSLQSAEELIRCGEPAMIRRVFEQSIERVSFDWQNSKIDIAFKKQ